MNSVTEHYDPETKETIAVNRALDNAKRVWAQLDLIKKSDAELASDLEKIKSTKVVPEHLKAALARRGTTPLAIVQTADHLATLGKAEPEKKTTSKEDK